LVVKRGFFAQNRLIEIVTQEKVIYSNPGKNRTQLYKLIFSFSIGIMKNIRLLEQIGSQEANSSDFFKISSQIEQLMTGSSNLEEHFIQGFSSLMIHMHSIYEQKPNKIYEDLIEYFIQKSLSVTSILLESKHSLRSTLQVFSPFILFDSSILNGFAGSLFAFHHKPALFKKFLQDDPQENQRAFLTDFYERDF
jgi:hypothetical protein